MKLRKIENSYPCDTKSNGYLYIIEFDEFVKIGITRRPKNRITQLFSLSRDYMQKEILNIYFSENTPYYLEIEKYMHSSFAEQRIGKGELFKIDIQKAIDVALSFKADNKHKKESSELHSINGLSVNNAIKEIANQTGESGLRNKIVLWIITELGIKPKEIIKLNKKSFIECNNLYKLAVRGYVEEYSITLSKSKYNELFAMINEYHDLIKSDIDTILWSLPNVITGKRTELTQRSLQRIINAFGIIKSNGKAATFTDLRDYVVIKTIESKGITKASIFSGNSVNYLKKRYPIRELNIA